jgi:ribonuclease M5
MKRVKEAIVVEGRYDKNALSQVVDAVILETSGFGVFKDGEKLELLRRLAAKQGLIVFTDPDGAGFVIRNFLKGAIPKEQVKHAYIPDIYGKERRKRAPGKEGKLGVEGVSPQILLDALTRAGATFLDEDEGAALRHEWTAADLYVLGLTGQPDSALRRKTLLGKLGLPEHMNTKALLTVLNALYSPEELNALL